MKKIIIIAAIMMLIIINNSKTENIIIPNEAIRIRIIANTNEQQDIIVKENLKTEIENLIYELLKDVKDIEKAREIIKENISNIDVKIKNNLIKQRYNQKYNINYGLNYFPEKQFKGIKYEEGYYESLVVTLGKGEGDNWWCVLYPPLCMLETENIKDIEYKSFVSEMLSKYLNK